MRICFVAILLGTVVLAAGCGGGGDDAPRVTLTDKSCTYSGARTYEPGVLEIEAKNTTSHFASFSANELAPGFSIKDVRQFYERVMAPRDGGEMPWDLHPGPEDFFGRRPRGAGTGAYPQATTVIPLNESSGRFVIVCSEDAPPDTGQDEPQGHPPSLQQAPPLWTYYVAGELEIRSNG